MKRTVINELKIEDLRNAAAGYECIYTKAGSKIGKDGKQHTKTVSLAMIPCGFDIESYLEFMYIWTFTICDLTIIGYTWDDFRKLLSMLKEAFDLGTKSKTIHHRAKYKILPNDEDPTKIRFDKVKVKDAENEEKSLASKVLSIFIHNIKYEWAFMHSEVEVSEEPFYLDKESKRNPLNIFIDDSFILVDSYKLFPMPLEDVAKAYTKTQKTHDLNYFIPRNTDDAKNLSAKELDYCCNDTIILSELATFVFENFLKKYGKMPFTQNQMVKLVIKDSYNQQMKPLSKEEREKYMDFLNTLTLNQEQYKLCRRDAFRGGLCLSSSGESDKNEKVGYNDITSAHCGSLVHEYFPMSGPSYLKNINLAFMTEDQIDYYCERFCCQMQLQFYNLRLTGNKYFKYETVHKAVNFGNKIETFDGHITSAENIVVSLTELDWEIYKKVYAWDKVEVIDFIYETRGELPDYVKLAALNLYGKKSAIKKAGKTDTPDYISAKTLVSNVFGAMVQGVSKDLLDGPEKYWTRDQLDRILKPLWGVYIAAHTRKKLADMIIAVGYDRFLYSDTDSMMYIKDDFTTKLFEEANEKIRLKNKAICEKYGLDFNLYDDLGCWDNESRRNLNIIHFKTLGSKQYIYYYTDNKHPHGAWKVVLAGISEDFFWEAYAKKYPVCKIKDKDKEIDRIFKFFDKNSVITYKRKVMRFVDDIYGIVNGKEVYCKTGAIIETKEIKGTLKFVSDARAIIALADEADDDTV